MVASFNDLFIIFILLSVFTFNGRGQSSLRFGNTQNNNMVLQQSPYSAKVWGYSVIGSIVDVSLILSTTKETIDKLSAMTDSNGLWFIYFKPITASNNEYEIIAKSGNESKSLSNILFGDVFLCGGQSNMQFTVDQVFNASEEVNAANNYPYIRLMTAAEIGAASPQIELLSIEQAWSIASNETVGGGNWSYMSAMCWFFGRNLYEYRKYPVGLIGSNYGGTPIRYWSAPNALQKCNETVSVPKDVLMNDGNRFLDYHNYGKHNDTKLELADSQLWNAQIYPFLQTTIRGVIWYQGESDAYEGYAQKYACAFPAMIESWRKEWSLFSNTSADFPFGYVHLSTWNDAKANVTCGNNIDCQFAAIVRWGQSANYGFVPNDAMPNTFMASAIDFGDPSSPFGDIHPRYKQQVAERLSIAAKAVIYGEKGLYWQGPIVDNAKLNGTDLIIVFRNIGSDGLVVKNSYGFEVYDEQQQSWIAIKGVLAINGENSVQLPLGSSIDVSSITQVRYGWFQAPCFNNIGPQNCAISSNGLPTIPFIINVNSL